MKRIIMTLSIATCLLLPSAAVVLAADPLPSMTGTGLPGLNNGLSCNTGAVGPAPGNSVNATSPLGTSASPFNTEIASTFVGNVGNPTAPGGVGNPTGVASPFGATCFQQMP